MANTRVIMLIGAFVFLVIILAWRGLASDDRINQMHHFGGDAPYCYPTYGCRALDMYGQFLWEVPQRAIDRAIADGSGLGIAPNDSDPCNPDSNSAAC
jgi:hypothetical protein